MVNHPQSKTRVNRNEGFSLFELLIALLVMSIGLLGLAQLQSTGIRSNDSATQRTLATFLAADVADRLRSNMTLMSAGQSIDTKWNDLNALLVNTTGGGVSDPGCGSTCVGADDIADWAVNGVQGLLPGGQAIVARKGGFFEITIMWDDNRSGATGTTCNGSENDLTCFQTLFLP